VGNEGNEGNEGDLYEEGNLENGENGENRASRQVTRRVTSQGVPQRSRRGPRRILRVGFAIRLNIDGQSLVLIQLARRLQALGAGIEPRFIVPSDQPVPSVVSALLYNKYKYNTLMEPTTDGGGVDGGAGGMEGGTEGGTDGGTDGGMESSMGDGMGGSMEEGSMEGNVYGKPVKPVTQTIHRTVNRTDDRAVIPLFYAPIIIPRDAWTLHGGSVAALVGVLKGFPSWEELTQYEERRGETGLQVRQ
jgi:hypothetical protein